MSGLPVTVRLLDPPLHEFLPSDRDGMHDLAEALGLPLSDVVRRVEAMGEYNPMLGMRGVRLGVTVPEIYEMQARAIFVSDSSCVWRRYFSDTRNNDTFSSTEAEIKIMKDLVIRVAKKVQDENKIKIDFLVGTMIELPRAAIKAKDIAKHAEFFSFGTNDLTQTTFGISRDDSGKFLNDYIDNKIFTIDPFVSIDDGVKDLVELAVEKGKNK